MKTVRIIPRLDIKGPNLVKGIHLEGLRVLGRPEDFAKYYYENGADELIYQDVVASLYGRNSLKDIISRTSRESFIPLTVGGGIRSLDDIYMVLRAGADKVSINTAAIKTPGLIKEAAEKFGSSTIVIAIEVIKQGADSYFAFTDNGREFTGIEVVEWAKSVEDFGAGEILLTSVDRDGTGLGFDLDLISKVAGAVSIPVIAHGGAGKIEHIAQVLEANIVDAFAISSLLHYQTIKSLKSDMTGRTEGNIDFLLSGKHFSKILPVDILELKNYLHEKGFNCR
jgi:imidazole glycerol-phosphate synthase subunit HisF